MAFWIPNGYVPLVCGLDGEADSGDCSKSACLLMPTYSKTAAADIQKQDRLLIRQNYEAAFMKYEDSRTWKDMKAALEPWMQEW